MIQYIEVLLILLPYIVMAVLFGVLSRRIARVTAGQSSKVPHGPVITRRNQKIRRKPILNNDEKAYEIERKNL